MKIEHRFGIAVASWAALLVLCVAWELWLAPIKPQGSWLWLKALPIALTLPGLRWRTPTQKTFRALQRALLTSTLYLFEGSVRLFEPYPVRALALAELVLFALFFIFAIAVLRPLKQHASVPPKGIET